MFGSKQLDFDKFFSLPNPGLRAYYGRVRAGQPEEYKTNFYGKETPLDTILGGWEPHLKAIAKRWPSLVEFENDLRKKVGPLSIMKPLSERMDDIDSYYTSILLDAEPVAPEAIRATISEFSGLRGLRIKNLVNTILEMKKSTNSGSPYFTKRRHIARAMQDWKLGRLAGATYQFGPDPKTQEAVWYWITSVLGWRGQEGGPSDEDVKQRVVWMFPFVVNAYELQLYQVLIQGSQHFNYVPAWNGMEHVDRRLTELFDTKGDNLIVCTDFSKFDQHYNSVMQDCSLAVLDGLFTNDENYQFWRKMIYPIKYNIPLAYDWGKIRFGPHGMGSGSGGTNGDETEGHRCLQHEAAILNNTKLNPASMCLGDDGVLSYPGITVDQVVAAYTRHGLEMNPTKQYVSSDDCVFLRRWHHKDYRIDDVCVGVYSTYRALGRLCEQERFYDPKKWNAKMVALRQLSIIENCKYHPLREEFAEYCMKGDRYRLGIDIPGFLENIESIAQEAIEFMPDFLGYTKTEAALMAGVSPSAGIKDWWIVKFLKQRARK